MQVAKTSRKSTYSDEFVAAAIVLLQANGWPEIRGAQAKTARQLDVPQNTLIGWANESNRNVHKARTFDIVKAELAEMWSEGASILYKQGMERRDELSAMQAFTAAAISTDKMDILTRGPAVNVQVNVIGSVGEAVTPWVDAEAVQIIDNDDGE